MIKVNEYLEGKVKSLGFEIDGTQCTVGVMLPGEYSFDTEKKELITVTSGKLEIRPRGEDWITAKVGDTVVVPANSALDLKVNKPASYICRFK